MEEKLKSLQKKTDDILAEKYSLSVDTQTVAEWKKNPLAFFQQEFFGLTQEELHITDSARPIEFSIAELSREDQVEHLSEMSQINKSKAFRRETDAMIKDISRNIVLLDESGREVKRQLILFIIGLRMRIGSLATKFDSTHQPITSPEVVRK